MFGVAGDADPLGLGGGSDGSGASRQETLAPYLDSICAFRDQVRSLVRAKAEPGEVLRACDALRDSTLPSLGVKLDDTGGGALWKLYECAGPPVSRPALPPGPAARPRLDCAPHRGPWLSIEAPPARSAHTHAVSLPDSPQPGGAQG